MWVQSGGGPNDPWRWVSRSVDDYLREQNARSRAQLESVRRLRRSQSIQVVSPPSPAINTKQGAIFDQLRQAGEKLRMFHFSLQFGRLRIEITRASSKP